MDCSGRIVEIAEPLIAPSKVRPQGGGTQDTPDETLFATLIYVLVGGCAWRALPPCFGISKSTAHRRFVIRSRAGVWGRLHEAVVDRIDECGLLDLSPVVLDSVHVRAKQREPGAGVTEPLGAGHDRLAGLQLLRRVEVAQSVKRVFAGRLPLPAPVLPLRRFGSLPAAARGRRRYR